MSRRRRKDRLDEDQLSVAEVVKRQRRLDKEQEVVTHTPVFASALKNVPDTPSEFHSVDWLQQGIEDVQDDAVVDPICNSLKVQIEYLESVQCHNDSREQAALYSRTPGLEMSQECLQMQSDVALDGQENAGEAGTSSGTGISVAEYPGNDGIAENARFGIIANPQSRRSLDAAYMSRLEEQFTRAATLGNEDVHEMDPDTLNDAEDNDQLESDDPKVVGPIPLLCSGIEDHERLLTADALNNSYVRMGEAAIAADLVAGGLLPTSFSHFWMNILMHSVVADGNFKADHVRQSLANKHKEIIPDIWLGEGGQFMTPLPPYLKYLKEKHNSKPTKAPCENQFRVLEQAMLLSKACNVKGIVALACARHGCFIPTCVANLPAGEQQKNVDYILQELFRNGNFREVRHILFMYDIVCQYIVHLAECLGTDIPQHLTIDQAIGLMHGHSHKDDCFQCFASSFIRGAAITAGKILETLWASLNKVSSQARTATLAHHAEILNDHMSNINWKKILNMHERGAESGFLCQKYQEAIVMHDKATTYHDGMTTTLKAEDCTRWDREIERAEVERIKDYKAMDIMKARDIKQSSAMSSTDTPAAEGSDPNEDWICLSLMIEEQQRVPHCLIVTEYKVIILHRIEIQDKVRRLIRSPQEEDRKAVEAGCDTIAKQLTILAAFQAKAGYVVQDLCRLPEPMAETFDDLDEPPLPDPDADLRPERATAPENTILPLPSSANIPLNPLRPLEIKLRIKQADHYLQNLCGDIAKKSFLYTNTIRVKTIKAVMTWVRGNIAKINYHITSACQGYSQCRASLAALGADWECLKKYAKLEKGDTKSSTTLLNPNEPGSTQLQLSWIWLVDSLSPDDSPKSLQEFQHVHYLQA
ncbi:hypothetical protein DXG01_014630 [Tephrocybe rancida]|nr:hypothetical protein DXG01_014630 [Tephrocybe rancida]